MFFFKSEKKKPIAVFLRHCFFSSVSHDKERLKNFSKKQCFENFLDTIDQSLVDFTVLLDCAHGDEKNHFTHSYCPHDVFSFKGGSESASFLFMLDHVVKQKLPKETLIYFLEEDYLHKKNWSIVLLEAMQTPAHYYTLYDHRDKYFYEQYKELRAKIYLTPSSHWRTTPSTTNTYAMKMRTLKKDLAIHQKYSENRKITADHEKFIFLRKKGRELISALPGWATHCEPKYASPGTNWEQCFIEQDRS